MITGISRRAILSLWQLLFLLLATTWLWAPQINEALSPKTSLISQYEAPLQPYNWLFRSGDMLAALLLGLVALALKQSRKSKPVVWGLLLIIAAGMFIDPTFASACRLDQLACREHLSASFMVHATETVVTAFAIFLLSGYDAWIQKRLVSILFVGFQILYSLLLLSQLATANHFNTISQYGYQLISILWLAWYAFGSLEALSLSNKPTSKALVRNVMAGWAFVNGVIAVVFSLAHLHLLGNFKGLYFAGGTAWLAQHGIVVGILMIYLSRQLARGERRARQIFLFICGLEIIKYALITPSAILAIYLLTFCILFVLKNQFYRGTIVLTWRTRLKEAAFMAASLTLVATMALILLNRDNRHAVVAAQAIDNFFDYSLRTKFVPKSHLTSALLAHTISTFILMGAGIILWILFKPHRRSVGPKIDSAKVTDLLGKYSSSAEDYFKLWPKDKDYFWSANKDGFIAYKTVGSIVFALADPISSSRQKNRLVKDFLAENRARRLKTCFLPISQKNLSLYKKAGLESLQIGAVAVIQTDDFIKNTALDKWWRWKKNRAIKVGYFYGCSTPPQPEPFIKDLKLVSDDWLKTGGHKERGFALGHFDDSYMQKCVVHFLANKNGQVVAFTNLLPLFKTGQPISVDLMRYKTEAADAMPYLLLKTIQNVSHNGHKYFDLGFVPFTASKEPVVRLAKILSTGMFSARGLEQFKNKFKPDWQPNFLAYDGDLGDLALIAVNLENLMKIK